MKDGELIEVGLQALIDFCRKINKPYSIQGRFKVYGYEVENCTVSVSGHRITHWGTDCQVKAIRDMMKYLISNFDQLSEYRQILIAVEEKEYVQGLA